MADHESMSGARRLRFAVFLYWVFGLAVIAGCTIGGILTAWPATMIVITPIVAMFYLGTPTMVTDLRIWARASKNESARGADPVPADKHSSAAVSVSESPAAAVRADRTRVTLGSASSAWDTRLNPVVAELAQAIPRHDDIVIVATEAGLEVQSIPEDRSARNYWHEILRRARSEGKVADILHVATGRAPDQSLAAAIERYRAG